MRALAQWQDLSAMNPYRSICPSALTAGVRVMNLEISQNRVVVAFQPHEIDE